jgi:hypothetical protein
MKDSKVPKLRFPLQDYLQDYYQDRDVDITCQTTEIVKIRKDHDCNFGLIECKQHIIPKGKLAVKDTALIDHYSWGTCYSCIPCLDNWIACLNCETCESCKHWAFNDNDDSDQFLCLNPESEKHNSLLRCDNTCANFERYEDEQ